MNISLREYDKQIEALVENSQVEEAVAHCRHILKEYPQHVDTRRLLGSAYLDARKYALAKDVFQHVLLAMPADFVANLGMSFIYGVEGNLTQAIWFIERAYEKTPNNIGIQDELKKLYTQRDGQAPERIAKTDGVLAYLYANSGEYEKAEQIILQILAADLTRREMKSLLAKVYFQMGRLEQAVAVCKDCLAESAYNFEANRLMIKLLQQADPQELEPYHRRLQELDPYAIHPDSWLLAEELFVPEQAVQLGRLDWAPEAFAWEEDQTASQTPESEAPQPDEATDVINSQPTEPVEEIPEPEPLPSWISDLAKPQAEQAIANNDQHGADDDVPSWVREIEPDAEPVFEHIEPEQPNEAAPDNGVSNENQPLETAEYGEVALEPGFTPLNGYNAEQVLNDPEIERVVQQVLQDLPLEEESDTQPQATAVYVPEELEATRLHIPIGHEVASEDEMLRQVAANPSRVPVASDGPGVPPWLGDISNPSDAPELPNSKDPLPNYAELEWLGDLGRVYVDPSLEETRLSPLLAFGSADVPVTPPTAEEMAPVEEPIVSEPVQAPVSERRHLPGLPNVALPGHIRNRNIHSPVEETAYEPVQDLKPESELDNSAGNVALHETPNEPIEEIVGESDPAPAQERAIGGWIPAYEDNQPKDLPETGEVLDDPSVLFGVEDDDPSLAEIADDPQVDGFKPLPSDEVATQEPTYADEDGSPLPEEDNKTGDTALPQEPALELPKKAESDVNVIQGSTIEEATPVASQAEEPAPAKRKRGRPAKKPASVVEAEDSEDVVDNVPEAEASEDIESTGEAPLGYLPEAPSPADVPVVETTVAEDTELEKPARPARESSPEDLKAVKQIERQIAKGDLEAALANCKKLILQEAALPQVIGILNGVLDKNPDDLDVWRTLGDAYFNNNQIEEALDAYAKADGDVAEGG